jgi:hypothetical protein
MISKRLYEKAKELGIKMPLPEAECTVLFGDWAFILRFIDLDSDVIAKRLTGTRIFYSL